MAKQAWKVKLYEAQTPAAFATSGVAANFVDVFGVQADGPDEAKREAKEWLLSRGHSLRSVNVSTEVRTLLAYVAAGSVEAAKKKAGQK